MIKETEIYYSQPTYEHTCKDLDEGIIDRIYSQYNPWSKKYAGWIMQIDTGHDYPDSMVINFCPYCGEKLPDYEPKP